MRGRTGQLEAKDFVQPTMEAGVWVSQRIDQVGHVGLPPIVDLACRHMSAESVEVIHLEIPEQLIAAQEDRVSSGAGCSQLTKHLRPDRRVTPPVLRFGAWTEGHHEPDAFHVDTSI
jgi:hypothetical protein